MQKNAMNLRCLPLSRVEGVVFIIHNFTLPKGYHLQSVSIMLQHILSANLSHGARKQDNLAISICHLDLIVKTLESLISFDNRTAMWNAKDKQQAGESCNQKEEGMKHEQTGVSAEGTLRASMLPHRYPRCMSHPCSRTLTFQASSFCMLDTFCVPANACSMRRPQIQGFT
jgi:hypothetical protein